MHFATSSLKINQVFDALQKGKRTEFKQKIFFKGQIYDAYELIIDIIKTAKNKIAIIDKYIKFMLSNNTKYF